MNKECPTYLVEELIGCKWVLRIIAQIRQGIIRPGRIRRGIPGLTTKVMNERFARLIHQGIVRRKVFQSTSPQHVEYHFTKFGQEFANQLAFLETFAYKKYPLKSMIFSRSKDVRTGTSAADGTSKTK